jgi:hypothetical protein
MDNAVALVQAYLRVNGYLTVTEFPVVEIAARGDLRCATDLDVLAFRFPHAGVLVPRRGTRTAHGERITEVDPALGVATDQADMIIGEVKEGRAELNKAASQPEVLATALTRFGCCPHSHAAPLALDLLRHGSVATAAGHRVRLVAFGSLPPAHRSAEYAVFVLSQVIEYLRSYMSRHWDRLQSSESKDPGLGFLMTLEKAARGEAPRDLPSAQTFSEGVHP